MKFTIILIYIDSSINNKRRRQTQRIVNEITAIASKAHYLKEEEVYRCQGYSREHYLNQFDQKGIPWGLNPLGYYRKDSYDEIEEGEEWKHSDSENPKSFSPYTKNSFSVLIQYTDDQLIFNEFRAIVDDFDDSDYQFSFGSQIKNGALYNEAKISEYEYLEIKKALRKAPNKKHLLKEELFQINKNEEIIIELEPLFNEQKPKRQ